MYHFKKKDYIRNAIIYKEGDPPSKAYVVRRGEFQESCKVSLNEEITDEESLPLIPKEKKKKRIIKRSEIPIKKYMCTPSYMRIVDVLST